MATLTIRNVSPEVVERLRESARRQGHSMEQEVRNLLESRYGSRTAVLERIRTRWAELPVIQADEVEGWKSEGRP